MNDQTQHILGAADSAHQGIELAISLLQESLGNMGEILTQGCVNLGPASLGSTMRLGQSIKEVRFILDDLLEDALGLCVLLGHDLGVCEDNNVDLGDISPRAKRAAALWYKSSRVLEDDPAPGEDEFDDDEQPF